MLILIFSRSIKQNLIRNGLTFYVMRLEKNVPTITATWKLHVLVLPLVSIEVHVTLVFPIVKLLPDGRSQEIISISPELSITIGSCQTATVVVCPWSVSNDW